MSGHVLVWELVHRRYFISSYTQQQQHQQTCQQQKLRAANTRRPLFPLHAMLWGLNQRTASVEDWLKEIPAYVGVHRSLPWCFNLAQPVKLIGADYKDIEVGWQKFYHYLNEWEFNSMLNKPVSKLSEISDACAKF